MLGLRLTRQLRDQAYFKWYYINRFKIQIRPVDMEGEIETREINKYNFTVRLAQSR